MGREVGQQLPHSWRPASIRLMDNVQFHLGQCLRASGKDDIDDRPPEDKTTRHVSETNTRSAVETVASSFRRTLNDLSKGFSFLYHRLDPKKVAVVTMLYEGSRIETNIQLEAVRRLVMKHGGVRMGASHGEIGYQLTFAVAYLRDFALTHHILAESFEAFVPWSCLLPLITRVRTNICGTREEAATWQAFGELACDPGLRGGCLCLLLFRDVYQRASMQALPQQTGS